MVIRRLISSAAAGKRRACGAPVSPSAKQGHHKENQYRSAEGETQGVVNDRVLHVHDQHMREVHVETVLAIKNTDSHAHTQYLNALALAGP